MQGRQMLAIVDQDTPLLCSDQEMSGGRREYRGDCASFGILRSNLTETLAIESQQTILRGGYQQLRFPAVRQQCRSKSDQRRGWQIPAGHKLPGRGTSKIVFQKSTWPTHIEMILKAGCLQEDRGRADGFKADSRGRSKWVRFEANLPFRLNLFRREPQRSLGAPASKSNH